MSPVVPGCPDVHLRPASELLERALHAAAPAVLIVDADMLPRIPEVQRIHPDIIVVAADAASEEALGDRADLSLHHLPDGTPRQRMLRAACRLSVTRALAAQRRLELTCTRHDIHKLNQVSIDLMHEHDRDVLLRRIVERGKKITESDAGCLFLVEHLKGEPDRLRPVVYDVDSIPDLDERMGARVPPPLPLDHSSIIGHAAVTGTHVVIDDAYHLPSDAPFQSNIDFEREFGYYARSLLAVPLLDQRDALIGVLAFVNRRRPHSGPIVDAAAADRYVLPYRRRSIRLGRAMASHAAVALENTQLYAQIEQILDRLVTAAVTAIDQRDPSTAGHSLRVATLTTALAKAATRVRTGRYRNLRFTGEQLRELHYAALLHDLGKVTVRENVLTKGRKLPPELWERVASRFSLIRAATPPSGRPEVERCWKTVCGANEPMPVPDAPVTLDAVARHTFRGTEGETLPYLTSEELHYLRIPRGTLDERERHEIESHVENTYQFLLQIPWTDDLKNVPTIAYGHHEKLDGSGYPRGLQGQEIPVQTRILTIADIFDALTAADRPYKYAVTPERALDILRSEARAGMLDRDLVDVLVDSQVYRQILRPEIAGRSTT